MAVGVYGGKGGHVHGQDLREFGVVQRVRRLPVGVLDAEGAGKPTGCRGELVVPVAVGGQ